MTLLHDTIRKEVEEISFIYRTLFPDTSLELHLFRDSPGVTAPKIADAEQDPLGPEYMTLGRLGVVHVGPEQRPGRMGKRIIVPLASPEQVARRMSISETMIAQRRALRVFYHAAPQLSEQLKFFVERRRLRRQPKVHSFNRLPVAPNSRLYSSEPQQKKPASKAPAVLIGMHWFDVGGAESLGIDTVKWALQAGLRVFLIAELDGPERLLARLPQHSDLIVLRTQRYLPRKCVPQFIGKLVEQENVVATHNHHCLPMYDALPLLRLTKPSVHNIDSTHIIEYADGGYPRASGVWSNFIDTHHVISDELVRFYNERFSVFGRKLKLGRLLDPNKRMQDIPPVRVGTGQSVCRVCFVGRMVHQKRPTVALKIMQKLSRWGKRHGVEFRFDIVGTGPYRPRVERLTRKYRLGNSVHLHDAGIDVPALLQQSDVLLLPSSNEGLALVCYEAIEAGCVPISTDVGGQSEICAEATLVDPDPAKAIRQSAKIVIRLLRERGFAESVAASQNDKMIKLRSDPTAEEVLGKLYRAFASGESTLDSDQSRKLQTA